MPYNLMLPSIRNWDCCLNKIVCPSWCMTPVAFSVASDDQDRFFQKDHIAKPGRCIRHNQITMLLISADTEKRQALCKSPWIIWVFQNKCVSGPVWIISSDSSDVQSKSRKLWPRRKVSCGVGTHTTTCGTCRSITSQLLAPTWLRWLRCWSFLPFQQLCVVC